MLARFAPDDDAHLRRQRLAERQWCRLAIAALALHNEIMPELDDADKT
jgi:hypothetical protein